MINLDEKNKQKCQYSQSCGSCDFLDLEQNQYQKTKKNLLEKFSLKTDIKEKINWIFFDEFSLKNKRRKISLQINAFNQVGFFAKNSKNIVAITSCFVADKRISEIIERISEIITKLPTKKFNQVVFIAFENVIEVIFKTKKKVDLTQYQNSHLLDFASRNHINLSIQIADNYQNIFISRKSYLEINQKKILLNGDIFLQATSLGFESIAEITRNFIKKNKSIKKIADIYSGFGAYSYAVYDLVEKIFCFEGDSQMVDFNQKNISQNQLNDKIKIFSRDLFFNPINHLEISKFDLAIINPPRNGATPQINEIAKSQLKNLIYVSCNPDSLLRDLTILEKSDFLVENIFAIDQFYATSHLEMVVILSRKNDIKKI